MSSVAGRRQLSALSFRHRAAAVVHASRRLLSTGAPLPPPTPPQQETPAGVSPEEPPGAADDCGSTRSKNSGSGPSDGKRTYEEERARVLRAALSHVARFGWDESAMIAGARDVGVSPAIIGSFPRKEAAIVEFFMDDCLQRLIDKIESGNELKDLIFSDHLTKLIRMRLEMQAPYVSKWPQALSIQTQPANVMASLKQRAELVDEIWHSAGDSGSDLDWYVKRTVLGGIYSTTELYMLTDLSPEFRDTWMFLHHRIKVALDLKKTVQEAAYFAEAVGAGMGNTMQGFMKGLFPRWKSFNSK